MAEHKHAAVLRAIADGKTVQCRRKFDGEWYEIDFDMFSPITHTQFEWRIKPEPKPDVVCSGCAVPDKWGFYMRGDQKPNLRLIFDGEDLSKLKSAEVLP